MLNWIVIAANQPSIRTRGETDFFSFQMIRHTRKKKSLLCGNRKTERFSGVILTEIGYEIEFDCRVLVSPLIENENRMLPLPMINTF